MKQSAGLGRPIAVAQLHFILMVSIKLNLITQNQKKKNTLGSKILNSNEY